MSIQILEPGDEQGGDREDDLAFPEGGLQRWISAMISSNGRRLSPPKCAIVPQVATTLISPRSCPNSTSPETVAKKATKMAKGFPVLDGFMVLTPIDFHHVTDGLC